MNKQYKKPSKLVHSNDN